MPLNRNTGLETFEKALRGIVEVISSIATTSRRLSEFSSSSATLRNKTSKNLSNDFFGIYFGLPVQRIDRPGNGWFFLRYNPKNTTNF